MKKIIIILPLIFLISCGKMQINQHVYFNDETNGYYCVNTYSNGLGSIATRAFDITTCDVTLEQVDSVKKEHIKLSEEFLNIQ